MSENEEDREIVRTAHKTSCKNCGETVVVIRHPEDSAMTARQLPTKEIRYIAIHITDLPTDFIEAARTKREFNALVSYMTCEKKPKETL